MSRKKWSPDEKLAIVMEMMKSEKPVTQICKEYGVNDGGVAYKWRDEALSAMQEALTDGRKNRKPSADAEKERLLKIIGEQAVAIDFQKKISQRISR